MEYLSEIKEIVSSYDKIREGLLELERLTKSLESRRAELDMALDANRKREAALIDKITKETGQVPDYFQIMKNLNEITETA